MLCYEWWSNAERTFRWISQILFAAELIPEMQGKADMRDKRGAALPFLSDFCYMQLSHLILSFAMYEECAERVSFYVAWRLACLGELWSRYRTSLWMCLK